CSNNSTFALQSNESPPFGQRPNQSTRSSRGWAESNRRTGPVQTAEISILGCHGDDQVSSPMGARQHVPTTPPAARVTSAGRLRPCEMQSGDERVYRYRPNLAV